ncbi:MAG: urease accessory protein UreD [Candidatus Binataceae bacterium]
MFSPTSNREPEPNRSSTGFTGTSCSRPDRVGREGLLRLEFTARGGQTILSRRRFTHPLQALDPFRAEDGSLCLMMLNTSGGMVGGDRLISHIEVSEDAAAALISASAAKVYRTLGPAARQETFIRLGPRATIEFLPDHVIPHPGAAYRQSLRVEMASGSRAIVYDAIAAGRIGRGEHWQFRELQSETIAVRESHPLYINRSRIVPAELSPAQLGFAERFNYLATMVAIDERRAAWNDVISEADEALNSSPGLRGGASEIACGGCAARFMAESATELDRGFHSLWGIMRRRVLGRDSFSMRRP